MTREPDERMDKTHPMFGIDDVKVWVKTVYGAVDVGKYIKK